MSLAMFVGSNYQLQNIVFGQALLRDESAESFAWLFTMFNTCMHGHEPHVLLTGECFLMKRKGEHMVKLCGSIGVIC
jgi:hypothetical protein